MTRDRILAALNASLTLTRGGIITDDAHVEHVRQIAARGWPSGLNIRLNRRGDRYDIMARRNP